MTLANLGWNGMRAESPRDWYRLSDLIAAAAATGRPLTRHQVYTAIRDLPTPDRRYGHFRYGQVHLEAVLAAAIDHE